MYIPGTQALRDLIRSYFSSLFLTTHVHCLRNLAKGTVALPLCAQPLDCPSPSLRGQCLLPCDTSHLCSLLWVMSYHSIQAVTPWRNRPCLICVWLVTELLWYPVHGWYSVKCRRERQAERHASLLSTSGRPSWWVLRYRPVSSQQITLFCPR